jgi:hypothetical protein
MLKYLLHNDLKDKITRRKNLMQTTEEPTHLSIYYSIFFSYSSNLQTNKDSFVIVKMLAPPIGEAIS